MSKANGHMRRIDEVLALLTGVHQGTKGFIAFCPAHEDRKKKSLSVSENDAGDVLLHCFAGCTANGPEPVCEALGIEVKDLFADSPRRLVSRSSYRPESYVYCHADGTPAYKIKRTKDKEFYPYEYDRSQGEFSHRAGLNGTGRVLYHLDELTHNTQDTVYWVEGEKDADRLRAAGLVATTAAGGAEGTLPTLDALAGRDVVIVPDNDAAGRSYGARVAKALTGIAASVRWLALPGLPAKGDVSDFFDAGASVEEFLALAVEAPEYDEGAHGTEKPIRPARKASSRRRGEAIGHDELRDRWREKHPDMAHNGADWLEYGAGYWRPIHEIAVERQIMEILESVGGVRVTSSALSSVARLARASTYIRKDQWDTNADVLVFTNGTLEIAARNFREHRPQDYATATLPYDYDPTATCDVFLMVLREALPDTIDFIQEFAGYCLTPQIRYETALWFKGPRGCGKSSVIEGLVSMLGSKHGVLGLGEIESSPFALSRIPGKTLLTSTEQPASYLKSTHVIDALISGESLIVDRKHRDAEEIMPTAKIIWAMNELPRVANTTSGIFRRVKVVSFPELKRERRPEIKEFIKKEGAGILNWALAGLSRLEERGGFEFPESVQAATTEFQHSNDLPAQFVEEKCEVGETKEVAAQFFYNAYSEWCISNGHRAASSNRVKDDWERMGFWRRQLKGRYYWVGVEVRTGETL